jgi:hypothetical protein
MGWGDAAKHVWQQNKEQGKQALMDAWQAPQNLIGLGQGYAETGELPTHSMDPEGNREFRFNTPGLDPRSVGSVISADEDTITPDQLRHERVHTRQSRETGPAYMAARAIGEHMTGSDDPYFGHPYEDEAVQEGPDSQDKDYYNMMVEAMRRKAREDR